ncbi:targeting for Xklp2 [Brachionus plicatilis]|uniref:Targeting for Xklp2 n=1 Tax=Brachionus plicatilis TaxID=10195 RepID=A0A3M7SK78_BRAPC|nr:targeting for Xklp2 [Brachionus plicatilis]
MRSKIDQNKNHFFPLKTEIRAIKRHRFDMYLKRKEQLKKFINSQTQMIKEIEMKKEIDELRKRSVFKSNPIPNYRQFDIKPSEKELTVPITPFSYKRLNRLKNYNLN